MSSDKFHCANGHCLTDCALSSIDYDKDLPPRFCPYSGRVVCWKKRETTEKRPRLFDKITVSPEVLAEKFVFSRGERYCRRRRCETVCYEVWWSALTGEEYKSKAEAIAATVAELKGGEDE